MKKDVLYYEYAKKLTGEYKKAYDQISFYVEVMNPSLGTLPEIMNDVIDLLLSAQNDQRAIDTVIGSDRLQFCEDLVNSHRTSFLKRTIMFLRGYQILSGIAFVSLTASVFIGYSDGIHNPWIEDFEIGGIFFIIIFSCVIFYMFTYMRRFLVRHTAWYNKSIDNFLLLVLFCTIIFLSFSQSDYFDSMIRFPNWLGILLSLLVLILCTWDKYKEKRRDIETGNYYSFDILAYNSQLEHLQKQYHKYEKKCTKKQKPIEDVDVWYEKHYWKDQQKEKIGKCFYVIIALMFIINVFLTSTFFDSCIFSILMAIFFYFYYRFLNKSTLAKQAIYKKIKEKKTSIFDNDLIKEDLPI